MLNRNFMFIYLYDPRKCVYFNPRRVQRFFHEFADGLSHAWHNLIAHFYYQNPGFTMESAEFKRVAQQISHLGGQFTTAGSRADDRECQRASNVLWWCVGGNVVQSFNHPSTQIVGVYNLSEGNGELFGALDSDVVCDPTYGQNEHIVTEFLCMGCKRNRLRGEVNPHNLVLDEVHRFIQQFTVLRRNVPLFNFAAQVLIKHRREGIMVFITY